MKTNQKGAIGPMFVILLIVLLAFSGFVVWRVTSLDNETADSTVSTENASQIISNNAPSEETESTLSQESQALVPSTETGSETEVRIDSLNLVFTSELNSEIIITENKDSDSSVYLSTKNFIDHVKTLEDYPYEKGACEVQIAGLAVFNDSEAAKSNLQPFVYDDNFDDTADYIGDGSSLKQLNDGRFVSISIQTQAVCYDTVHLEEASLILAQMDDLRAL